jgi:hypothetical protein
MQAQPLIFVVMIPLVMLMIIIMAVLIVDSAFLRLRIAIIKCAMKPPEVGELVMNPPEVGKLAPETAFRDAIHVAVAPVIASTILQPGEHVGYHNGKSDKTMPAIGIVDPFLTEPVQKDEKFWLFLYPGSITSLRHVWTHNAFSRLPSK